jgi:tetratricopeptide (TPR) repeat protein
MSDSTDLIKNVEIPVCLNLGLCYLKTDEPHYAIKYLTQVIDKNIPEKFMAPGTLEKSFYRRGTAYFNIGDLAKAKEDLKKANELSGGKNAAVIQALKNLKSKYEENRQKERELSQKMIQRPSKKDDQAMPDIKGSDIFTNKILALLFDIVFLIYNIVFSKLLELVRRCLGSRAATIEN